MAGPDPGDLFSYARAAPGKAAALNESREALRALPEEAAHALDPEPGPAEVPAAAPPPPPDLPVPDLPPADEPARTPYLDQEPLPAAEGLPAADPSAEDFRHLTEMAGGQAGALALLKLLQGQGAATAPPTLPPAAPEAAAPPGPPTSASETSPFTLPLPQPPAAPPPGAPRPFALPPPEVPGTGAPAGQAPEVTPPSFGAAPGPAGVHPAPAAEPVPGFEAPPLAWPVQGPEDLAEAAALAAPETPGAAPDRQPPPPWPVLGEADLAGESFGRPELPETEGVLGAAGQRGPDPFAGLFRPAGPEADFSGEGFGVPQPAGGGGGDLVGLLTRIAEGVEKLIEVMGQAQEAGGASFGGRPGRAGPGDDFGYDDDPETPASPSEDLEALFRPGKTQDAFGRPEPEAPKRQRRAAAEEL